MKKKIHTKGFTLLEVMVSFAILSIVFGTILSFLVTTLKATQFSRQELIAHGLAEEGLEMVRALRDKRFLDCENQTSPCDWKSFVANTSDTYQIVKDFFSDNVLSLERIENIANQQIFLCENENKKKVYVGKNLSSGSITCKDSGLRREISFPTETIPRLLEQDITSEALLVRSKVFWFDGAETKEFILEETLYNWKL